MDDTRRSTHLVAVTVADGLLAITVADGRGLEAVLGTHYGTRAAAADLVALGDLSSVGPTIADCVTSDRESLPEGPVELAGAWDLECHRMAVASTVHVFENGRWRHEVDAWMDTAEPDGSETRTGKGST